MKKLFAVLIAFTLIFAACEEEEESQGLVKKEEKVDENKPILTINNESMMTIDYVKWHGKAFARYYYTYVDSTLVREEFITTIGPGGNIKENVSPGSGYIFFDGLHKQKTPKQLPNNRFSGSWRE